MNLKSCDYLLGWSPDEGVIEKISNGSQLAKKKKSVTNSMLTLWNLVCDIMTGHTYGITDYFGFESR